MTTKRRHEQYTITDVELWNEQGIRKNCDVTVARGKIQKITQTGTMNHTGHVIAGTGKVLIPGGVDPQVHMRVPGQPEKETPTTGCAAAIRGGVTAMLTMPNTKPVIDTPEVVELTRSHLADAVEDSGVRIELSAAITRGQKGKEAVDFSALAKAGIAAFTDDGVGVVSDDHMRAVFRASAETGIPVLQHAETPGHGGVLAAGPLQAQLGMTPYPPEAESDMVERDLRLLAEFPGARYHVLHVSSVKTLDLIAAAKDKGLHATCEASPHHLFFTSEDVTASNPAFKMNPPLRSANDRSALINALRDGICDFVATDHAPHEAEIKTSNMKTAAYGTTGLETALRCLLTLAHRGELDPARLVQVFSTRPAAFLGLSDTEGRLAVDRPMRAVLVDRLNESSVVEDADLASRSHNNCFVGSFLNGRILTTFTEDRVFDHYH